MEGFWEQGKADDGREIKIWKPVEVIRIDPETQQHFLRWHHSKDLCINIVSGFWGDNTPFYETRAPMCIKYPWEIRKRSAIDGGYRMCGQPDPDATTRAPIGVASHGVDDQGSKQADHTGKTEFSSQSRDHTVGKVDPVYIYGPILGGLAFIALCTVAVRLARGKRGGDMEEGGNLPKPAGFMSLNWGTQAMKLKVDPAESPSGGVPKLNIGKAQTHHKHVSPTANGDRSASRSVTPRSFGGSQSQKTTPVTPIRVPGNYKSAKTPRSNTSGVTPRSQTGMQRTLSDRPNEHGFKKSPTLQVPGGRGGGAVTLAQRKASVGSKSPRSNHSGHSRQNSTPRGFGGTPRSVGSMGQTLEEQMAGTRQNQNCGLKRMVRQGTAVYEPATAGGDGGFLPPMNALPRFGNTG